MESLQPLRSVGMRYTPLTKKALAICFDAHKEQRDKSGAPYVFHPFHLAEQMETEAEICTALLHDTVEDSSYTLDDLRAAGFPEEILDAISLMTHNDAEPYMDYVARIRHNPIARRVKLADLAHNSTLARLDSPTPKDLARREKYLAAIALLQEQD